jgi:NNP family nitrate/nitrite transporter-like MFS transporter
MVYALVALMLSIIVFGKQPAFGALAALALAMTALGMGNGAVFQLVPQRFRNDVGLLTGLVGMTGGVGGFCLAAGLGYARQFTGDYAYGFGSFALLALLAWGGIASVRLRWRGAAALGGVRV